MRYYVDTCMLTSDAVGAFLNSCKSKGLAPLTVKWYRIILMRFAECYPELPADPAHLESFINGCPGKDERRHGYYRALKALYRFCKKRMDVDDASAYLDAPRRNRKHPRPLTPEDLSALLNFPHKRSVKAALTFLADTGCRVQECYNLKPMDFIERQDGSVVAIVHGKTGARYVPLSYEAYRLILPVLPFKGTLDKFGRELSQAFKDARIRGSGINLRHTFCTLWSGSEEILQKIAGHTSFKTTQGYRALRLEKMEEEHRKHSPLKQISQLRMEI